MIHATQTFSAFLDNMSLQCDCSWYLLSTSLLCVRTSCWTDHCCPQEVIRVLHNAGLVCSGATCASIDTVYIMMVHGGQ